MSAPRFDQIVKNNVFPGWHKTFTAKYMLINQDQWDQATDAQKALVEAACAGATMRGLAEGEYKNPEVLAGFVEGGVNAAQLPDDILMELRDVTVEVLAEEAAADEDFKRVYESQKAFMADYRVWDERAYVPSQISLVEDAAADGGEGGATGSTD